MPFRKINHKIIGRKLIALLFFIGLTLNTLAQQESEESLASSEKQTFKDKFFMALTTSTYTDIIISPLRYHYSGTTNTDTLGNPTFTSVPYQTQQFNIISLGFEPRFNLKEFDENSSLSLSVPISFGIGSSYSAAGDNLIVRGIEGFGSIQIPLLLKLNLGNGSTYRTQNDFGFNAGLGFEYNKVGLIKVSSEPNSFNRGFILPSVSAGITFLRGDSPMEVNFKYSFGKIETQEFDTQGDILKDGSGIPYMRNTRGQTIKLTFVYLMNY
jgi:hypothetical protein